jgi:uncharacterized Zn-binding protein involved in type VI secretion
MGRPAARVGDMTAHGTPLSIGPGSPNVFIGKRPAWRGVLAAQAAILAQKIAEGAEKIAKAGAAVTAASGTPASPAAVANFNRTVIDAATEAASLMSSFMVDLHTCPIDGVGVVITGSQTVLINGLAACRIGDIIQETTGVNSIVMGEMTVLVGG